MHTNQKKIGLFLMVVVFASNLIFPVQGSEIQKTPISVDKSTKMNRELLSVLGNSDQEDVIVIFESKITKSDRLDLLKEAGIQFEVNYNYDIIPGISIKIKSDETTLNQLAAINQIQSLSTNHIGKIPHVSSSATWDATDWDNWWLDAIGATDLDYTGNGVNIAIIDTGISEHPDFWIDDNGAQTRIIANKNFTYEESIDQPEYFVDDYGHGTHCAGIAAGDGSLFEGKFHGVAPEANLINAKTSNSTGYLEEDDVIAALEWAIGQGADIVSMSFGGILGEVWNAENLAIQNAVGQGVVVVAAAGNSGPDFYTSGSPGSGLYSIAVGASNSANEIASFSSSGPSYTYQQLPDILAPGVDIISTEAPKSIISKENRYTGNVIVGSDNYGELPLSGTSMATPMVAGSIALLLEAFPTATPETIRNALILGAHSIGAPLSDLGYGAYEGAGLINVTKSLEILENNEVVYGNVNGKTILFPRSLPYAPFSFLNYPGDSQLYNLTLINGNGTNIHLNFPTFENIELITSSNNINFDHSNLSSVAVQIRILNNASIGNYFDYINLTDAVTGFLIDQIPINISVLWEKSSIYFDSFHGLNDEFPAGAGVFSEIEIIQALNQLNLDGFNVNFNLQNFTPSYDAQQDAQMISAPILSLNDILVLQAPILPYSTLEMNNIKTFYENGGRILFLGSRSENLCKESINNLFTTLGVDISINGSLTSVKDYGIYAQANTFVIDTLNSSHPIFEGVDAFLYSMGSTFSIGSNVQELASYNGNSVVAASNNENGGKIIAFGDFHFMASNYFDNENYYGNHSVLLQNLFNYLQPNQDYGIDIKLSKLNNENYFDILIKNYTSDSLLAPTIGSEINASIIYPNSTIVPASLSNDGLNYYSSSNLPNNESLYYLVVNSSIGSNQSKSLAFYQYNEVLGNYNNITFPENITRAYNESLLVNLNASLGSLDLYVSITTNSFLSSNNISEFTVSPEYVADHYEFDLTTYSPTTAGTGIIFGTYYNLSNYLDLSPDRYYFTVENSLPEFDLINSTFGGVAFNETQDNETLYALQAEFQTSYLLEVYANETVNYEDNVNDFSISGSIWPIFVHNGYINLIYPNQIPQFATYYDNNSQSYYSVLSFPSSLTYSKGNETVSIPFYSDQADGYYAFIWITLRDKDNGINDFYIFIVLPEEPTTPSLTPLYIFFGVVGLIFVIIIIRKIQKKKRSPNPSENNVQFDPNSDHYYL